MVITKESFLSRLVRQGVVYNRSEILQSLPYGNSFCFLDNIIELDETKWKIRSNTLILPEYFHGHFKTNLIFPKALKEETIAQLGAYLIRSNKKFKDYIPVFKGESHSIDYDMVLPKDIMESELEFIDFDMHRKGTAKGKAYVRGELVHEFAYEFTIIKEDVLDKINKMEIDRRSKANQLKKDKEIKEELLYNRHEILKTLPHGDEFCFIDGVTKIQKKKNRISGYIFIKPSFFMGHFKNVLIFPKALKEEALAQLGAFMLRLDEKYINHIPIFSGKCHAIDHNMVFPGERMKLEIEIVKFNKMERTGTASGKAFIDDMLVHELEFDYKIIPEKVLNRYIRQKLNERKAICPHSNKMWMFLENDRNNYMSNMEIEFLFEHIEDCWLCQQEYKRLFMVDKELASSFEKWATNKN